MTIYYYGIDNNKGGMEIYAYNLIKNVVQNDHTFKFHILTCHKDVSFKKELLDLGCVITVLPSRKKIFKYYKSLIRILSKATNNDSLLQLNIMTFRNVLLFKAAKKSKMKTIIVSHSAIINTWYIKWINKYFKWRYRNFGFKVGVSDEALKNILYKGKCGLVINNGIEQDRFNFNKNKREELRKAYGIKEDEFVIGQVGRISKLKNQIFSCEVFKKIEKQDYLSMHFFGNVQENNVDDYIRVNSLGHHIFNHGVVNNVNDIYNMFDILLFPSIHEGAGLVLLEALCNGLTCLVSENVPELNIKSDKIIRLPLIHELWVDKINELRHSLKEDRTNALAGSVYDSSVQINEYINLYKNILKS